MNRVDKYVSRAARKRTVRRNRRIVLAVLAVLVSAGVAWQLRLSGVAMNQNVVCGFEEHGHTEACYTLSETAVLACTPESVGIHVHEDECRDEEDQLVCGKADYMVHEHTQECYDPERELSCGLDELKEHTHDDSCYKTVPPEHTHSDECYEWVTPEETEGEEAPAQTEPVRGALICGLEEDEPKTVLACTRLEVALHTHDEEECYELPLVCEKTHEHQEECYGDPVLVCEKLEVLEHIHSEDCFTYPLELSCEVPEHTHEDGCYITLELFCGLDEHTHGDDCYEAAEPGHTHDDSCYEWVDPESTDCTITEEEHVHDETCTPKVRGTLICQLEEGPQEPVLCCTETEHLHDDSCYQQPAPTDPEETEPEQEATALIYQGSDYTITVPLEENTALPENAQLTVRELLAESEEYQLCWEQAAGTLADETLEAARFFELTFLLDGEAVEPAEPVAVSITWHQLQNPEALQRLRGICIMPEEPQPMPLTALQREDGLTAHSFTYSGGLIGLLTPVAQPPVEADPEALPVDYYVYIDGQWALVGTTDTGWLAPEETAEDEIQQPAGTDALSLAQAAAVLGDYGFIPGEESLLTLAFQPKAEEAQPVQTSGGLTQKQEQTCMTLAQNPLGYNIYYLPNNQEPISGLLPEELDGEGNAFYTVTVQDPKGLIYTDEAEFPQRLVVKKGEAAELLVRNAPDVLWTIEGAEAETEILSFGFVANLAEDSTEEPQEITGTLVRFLSVEDSAQVLAVDLNPNFTVQYHAYLNIGSDEDYSGRGWEETKLIDTRNGGTGSGGNMPENGSANSVVTLYIDPATSRFPLAMATLTPIFRDKTHEFNVSPGLRFVNQLADNANYELVEVWVLKDGASASSTDPNDFTVYTNVTELGFSSDPTSESVAAGTAILIKEDTVIRLVYNPVAGTFSNGATFYDYDITDGKFYSNSGYTGTFSTQPNIGSSVVYLKTNRQGINSASNYSSSGTKLGFGNNNTNSGLANELFGGHYLNKYNLNNPNSDEHGCTYGLVTGLNSDGTVKYASGVAAPKLFNETGTVTGKTTFPGYNLNFYRNGDTYTLSSVSDASGKTVASDLIRLDLYGSGGNMPSNNFWPMDYVSYWKAGGGMKPGHDAAFGNDAASTGNTVAGSWRRYGSSYWTAMPTGDDGADHNSYFGMNFSLNFSLTEDYIGPLEYTFYGDDDLWIFLTYPDGSTKLICDIGGVHTSMGEYVDLWDWIKKGDSGLYKLSGFYTERGASGSTCWMNFTLPSVSGIDLSEETGDLLVSKATQDPTGADVDCSDLFQFQVDLRTTAGGSLLGAQYRYPVTITRKDGTKENGTISAGGTLSLYAGDTALIQSIPVGVYYEVTELDREGYHTLVNGSYGYIVSGTVEQRVQNADFVNIPGATLPSTGGAGTAAYVFFGALLTAAPLKYAHDTKKKGRRRRR